MKFWNEKKNARTAILITRHYILCFGCVGAADEGSCAPVLQKIQKSCYPQQKKIRGVKKNAERNDKKAREKQKMENKWWNEIRACLNVFLCISVVTLGLFLWFFRAGCGSDVGWGWWKNNCNVEMVIISTFIPLGTRKSEGRSPNLCEKVEGISMISMISEIINSIYKRNNIFLSQKY